MSLRRILPAATAIALVICVLAGCASRGTPTDEGSEGSNQASAGKRDTCLRDAPDWFSEKTLNVANNLVLTGYGCGRNPQLAKNRALDNAARQLGIRVKSKREQKLEEVIDRKREIEESFEINTTIEATHRIKNFDLVRRETIDGFYYVAYRIDRRPLTYIIVEDLMDKIGPENIPLKQINWIGPDALTKSKLVTLLEERLVNQEEGRKSIDLRVNLRRENGRWVLSVGDILKTIDNPDFARLLNWRTDRTDDFDLDLITGKKSQPANRLTEGDSFYFRLSSNTHENRHFALLNIYADGRICVLKQRTGMQSVQTIPSASRLKKNHRFKAVLLQSGKPTLDVYLAVRSRQPFSTAKFLYLAEGEQMCSSDKAYQVDDLLNWLDRNEIEATDALVVQILPE